MKSEPLKADTKEKLEALMQKKTKETQVLHPLPPYTVIFCEGTKTEPLYIRGFTERINKKYEDMTPKERITVIGTGEAEKVFWITQEKKLKRNFPNAKSCGLCTIRTTPPMTILTTPNSVHRIGPRSKNIVWHGPTNVSSFGSCFTFGLFSRK